MHKVSFQNANDVLLLFYFCNDFVHALTGTKTKHQDWEAALTLEALRGRGGGGGRSN